MPLRQVPLDRLQERLNDLRERLPQLARRGLGQLGRLPLPRPAAPGATVVPRWISWRAVAAALLLAGIVHICATFAASVYTSGHAYQLLRDRLPANQMVMFPQQAAGRQILADLPPDMLYAMCRYDLSGGPVAVTATVLGSGWALSLHTPSGSNFYVLPGQPTRRTDVSFTLAPSGVDAAPPIRRESPADTQIASPTNEGLVVLRGPLRGLAWTAETEATLRRATCAPLKR
jgi:uncharacterized membrane protein